MNAVRVSAPAKINLSLDITGRREDGYHLIRSVMQGITVREYVEISHTDATGITLTMDKGPGFLPLDHRNVAFKAAQQFLDHTGITPQNGIGIKITKTVPVGAGLAGGSADAAAVLAGMNELFNTGMATEELCRIGEKIGADVPFCILGGTALCTGTGTDMTPVNPMPMCFIVIAKPPTGISTAEAYRNIDAAEPLPPTSELVERAIAEGDLQGLAKNLGNVFDVLSAPSAVEEIKQDMRQLGAIGCQMSGSGSAVFGLFSDESAARACASGVAVGSRKVFLCRPDRRGAVIL